MEGTRCHMQDTLSSLQARTEELKECAVEFLRSDSAFRLLHPAGCVSDSRSILTYPLGFPMIQVIITNTLSSDFS
ncbi:hypothetical protein A0H81_01913 [Grifola frondosa]|uniref:Uncharacterized protein n=1 Tax=Grifola frondosa TaxID=5627 RepID=A0A1C7ML52_GRIFR|nr:hypothetical protein A0H81_01913 [Grifola frondosa]